MQTDLAGETGSRPRSPYAPEIRGLYLVAMAMFVVTVTIGILNGLDLVEFDRRTILTHVHSGTLGWITLSVLATTLWLFGEGRERGSAARWLAWSAAVFIPLYVLAFYLAQPALRAVTGTVVLLLIVAMLGWTIGAARGRPMTVPRLSLLAGLTTLLVGAIFGVLQQVQYATEQSLTSGNVIGAHAAAMAFSYLVLAAMGIIEWGLHPSGRLSRAGTIQVVLLFLAGLVLSLGTFANADLIAIGGIYLLAEVVAVLIFIARMWRPVLGVGWRRASPERHVGLAGIFVVVDIGILMYLIVSVIVGAKPGEQPDITGIPVWLIFALDHAIFIGVMTNLAFGLIRTWADPTDHRWPWADQVVFWGMNIGMVGFIVGLALESPEIKRAFSPIMGISILIGLLTFGLRLWAAREPTDTSPAAAAAA